MTSERVLEIFKEITTVPRESGYEAPFTDWLERWAASHSLACKRDKIGNILITKEASSGKEGVPTMVLQAHQDMVCEKNHDCDHDFRKDPIQYVIKNGWMVAEQTTLGADDGIGVAACLALLEDTRAMGKLECLFTISEETGMDGAEALEKGFFDGKTLINLDSEDEGQLFIGCAGGLNTNVKFHVNRVAVKKDWNYVHLGVKGGIGGHSGDDINKGRCNAVQELARFLYSELPFGLQLLHIAGGGKPNAIAREAEAVIAVPEPRETMERFSAFNESLKKEFCVTDPEIIAVSRTQNYDYKAIDSESAKNIITSLFTAPHGVYAMSQSIKDLVETSTNLASVRIPSNGIIEIVTSQRSSLTSQRRMMAAKVRANFEAAGAEVKHMYEYPGWTPDLSSNILKVTVEAYRRLFNQEPEVKAIHAGLECGLFLEKFPGLDMISFGPTLRGVHAPGERLELASMDKFVKLLEEVVCEFR